MPRRIAANAAGAMNGNRTRDSGLGNRRFTAKLSRHMLTRKSQPDSRKAQTWFNQFAVATEVGFEPTDSY